MFEKVAEQARRSHEGMIASLTLASDNVREPTLLERAAGVEALMALMLKEEFRQLMTPQALQIVMRIYAEPGISVETLIKRTGLTQSSVSRNLMALGKIHRLGKAGLNMVESVDDPQERRRRISFLTPNGRKLVAQVLSLQAGTETILNVEAPSATEFLNKAYRLK